MMDDSEECLRGVIADARRSIDADDWTAAYVRLLKLNYCDRAASCTVAADCTRIRDLFRRNIERIQQNGQMAAG
jgi:hypothetical protein